MRDKEKEKLIRRFFENHADISDATLSLMFDVDLETVQQMRDSHDTESRKAEMSSVRA